MIGGLAWLVIAIAIAATIGLMTLYVKHDRVRSGVTVLAVLPPVVVVYFLFFSAANSVVFPDDVEAVTLETLLGTDPENDLGGIVDNQDQPDSAVSDEAQPTNTSADRDDPDNAAVSPSTAGQAPLVERLNERFPPIYLLVFDELPWHSLLDETGRIDPVRYPNFARLAETSHVFNNATTVGFTTEAAVPALLASTLQTQPAPVYSMYPDNLFTLLGGVYDVSSWDPLVDLCPDSVCNGSTPEQVLDLIAGRQHRTGNQQHHHDRRTGNQQHYHDRRTGHARNHARNHGRNHSRRFIGDLIRHHHESVDFKYPAPACAEERRVKFKRQGIIGSAV